MARVLVVGGAGYVGSATVARLLERGHEPWVLDDLSTGFRELVLVPGFTHARAGDQEALGRLLGEREFDCVMHFAARSLVGESVRKRDEYFENNVVQTERLLESLLESGKPGHRRFIFSSTCAIFGEPEAGADIDESCPKKPINPYGESKLAAEKLLESFARDHGLQAIALRYFNAAGAEPQLRAGECHFPETHLIPRVVQAVMDDQTVEIYGTDYETEDGTCVRDYVHVTDLADAHVAAMERLLKLTTGAGKFEGYNLASEEGFSVREVVEAVSLVLGENVKIAEKPRRPGDPPRLVGDSALAKKVLGFSAQRGLAEIIRDAAEWEKKRRGSRHRAIFLDRDGTLNVDPGYLNDPEKVTLLPTVPEALAAIKRAGFLPIVISNQSGVNRGLVDPSNLEKIHGRINALLQPAGATVHEFHYCVHRPDEKCPCRKPEPGLVHEAAKLRRIDLASSYMIGDKLSDVEVGTRAALKGSVLVRTGHGRETEAELHPGQAAFIADSLLEAVNWILNRENAAR